MLDARSAQGCTLPQSVELCILCHATLSRPHCLFLVQSPSPVHISLELETLSVQMIY